MLKEINPINCSHDDLIYYLMTYKFRHNNVPQNILDKQSRYIVQLIIKKAAQHE